MPGRLDDGITGRIYLVRLDPPDRRTPCDTCRSRPALYEMRWFNDAAPVRGLCQRCVDDELTTPQFNAARDMERLRASLLDAELHKDADELAKLAESYEDAWNHHVEPPFVAAFIARHGRRPDWGGAIARGIVTDHETAEPPMDTVRLAAARLALLMMRAALINNADVRADAYLVADPNRLVTPDHAARILAAMPKRIACRATVATGYMAVQCKPLGAPQSVTTRGTESVFRPLRQAHGDIYSSLPMLCVGTGESLVVPTAAAESFLTDFQVTPHSFGFHTPEQCLAHSPQLARDARAAGAVYVLSHSSGAWASQIDAGNVIPLSRGTDRPSAVLEYTPGILATCESCGAEPAQWLHSDAATTPWTEQKLGDACAAAAAAAGPGREIEALERRFASAGQPDVLPTGPAKRRWLEKLQSPWVRLPMPPAVAEAFARLKASL